ncbi:MAG: CPBP family intramembrane glutamic endopeptidase [Myxococcota bacterium]
MLFYLPVVFGSLLFLIWSGGEYALIVRTVGEHPGRDVGVGLALGLALVVASRGLARLGPGRAMADALSRVVFTPSWAACAALALTSATGEELLFRGVLQPTLGVWVATALFALAHPPFERAMWPWPLLAAGVGAMFAALYEWSGAVLASVVAHTVLNGLNLWWLGRRQRRHREGLRQVVSG